MFAAAEDQRTLTLCIDDGFKGCDDEGRGVRLFDANGNRTQYLQSVLTGDTAE